VLAPLRGQQRLLLWLLLLLLLWGPGWGGVSIAPHTFSIWATHRHVLLLLLLLQLLLLLLLVLLLLLLLLLLVVVGIPGVRRPRRQAELCLWPWHGPQPALHCLLLLLAAARPLIGVLLVCQLLQEGLELRILLLLLLLLLVAAPALGAAWVGCGCLPQCAWRQWVHQEVLQQC
jgi:hypothetical protein